MQTQYTDQEVQKQRIRVRLNVLEIQETEADRQRSKPISHYKDSSGWQVTAKTEQTIWKRKTVTGGLYRGRHRLNQLY